MAQISGRTARARAAMELKLTILSALNKLGDRDTQQMAVEELQKIAENLSQEGIGVFLSCIFDVGADQKLTVRKECVRILAALSVVHGEMLSPHLSRIVSFVMRRLKDPDTQIRDVCVETMGVLVARVPPAENSTPQGGFLAVYTKPLFDAMGEQTKNVQVGAAMCLGRVIESAPNLTPACVHRLTSRIVKVLSNPGFMARAALLSASGSLSRVVKDSGDENLAQLVPCVQESLHSSDWTARKAAAETLSVLASPGLSKMKPSTLGVLDSYRFDKVKPVRDAVTCAIQVWKTVPGPELDSSLKLKSVNSPLEETPSFSRCWKEPEAEAGGISEKPESSIPLEDKTRSGRKRAPATSDLKPNPDFFRKLDSKTLDNWEVEVAVPRVSPSQEERAEDRTGSSGSDKEFVSAEAGSRTPLSREATDDNNSSRSECEPPSSEITTVIPLEVSSKPETRTITPTPQEQSEEKVDRWEAGGDGQSFGGSDWILIQRQICQLERGQTELLEMLQDFMCTCQESMLSLQDRVQRLERSVENIEKGSGKFSTTGSRNISTLEYSSRNTREHFKLSDYEERFSVHSGSGRDSPYSNQELRTTNYTTVRKSPNFASSDEVTLSSDFQDQPPVARRAWDRARHGEGPSARSVWRASKDEATLEAIRGAPGDELVVDKLPDMILETAMEPAKQVAAPSWLFWTRAMENLHGGDVDSAYEEALSAEDDLLLVRMMNQTGPAFEHFSNTTAASMMRALMQILHQQHFLDAAFPWLEQVAEMVRTKGGECFKFSMDTKRELVSSLHDTSALDFPERWMGNAVAKLALQLATAWSVDLLE